MAKELAKITGKPPLNLPLGKGEKLQTIDILFIR